MLSALRTPFPTQPSPPAVPSVYGPDQGQDLNRTYININMSDYVSILRHSSNYSVYSQGQQRLNGRVFRRLWKTDSDGADLTCCGRLFHTWAATTGQAASPTVDNRVRQTTSNSEEVELRRRLPRGQPAGQVCRQGMTVLLRADKSDRGISSLPWLQPVQLTEVTERGERVLVSVTTHFVRWRLRHKYARILPFSFSLRRILASFLDHTP